MDFYFDTDMQQAQRGEWNKTVRSKLVAARWVSGEREAMRRTVIAKQCCLRSEMVSNRRSFNDQRFANRNRRGFYKGKARLAEI